MFVIVLILMSRLDVDVERQPGEHIKLKKSISQLIRLVDVDFFMVMMLLLGTFWGFLESFLFVYLTELEASSYLLGKILMLFYISLFFLIISFKSV